MINKMSNGISKLAAEMGETAARAEFYENMFGRFPVTTRNAYDSIKTALQTLETYVDGVGDALENSNSAAAVIKQITGKSSEEIDIVRLVRGAEEAGYFWAKEIKTEERTNEYGEDMNYYYDIFYIPALSQICEAARNEGFEITVDELEISLMEYSKAITDSIAVDLESSKTA